jgi:hypothetical protein
MAQQLYLREIKINLTIIVLYSILFLWKHLVLFVKIRVYKTNVHLRLNT